MTMSKCTCGRDVKILTVYRVNGNSELMSLHVDDLTDSCTETKEAK